MRTLKISWAVLGLMLLGLSSTARAQSGARLLVQGYGAFVPTSEGLAIEDGWSVTGTLGVSVLSRIWLMGSYSYYWHSAKDDLPDWNNRGYFAMLGYDLVPPGMNGNMILYAGAGEMTFELETEPVEVVAQPVEVVAEPNAQGPDSETFFAVNAGVKVVYELWRHVAWTADLGVGVSFSDGGVVGGDMLFFPIGIGLGIRF